MPREIDLSEQQILGYVHAKRGFCLTSLVEAMALKKVEWETIKREVTYLTKAEVDEIDNYFKR